MSASNEGSSSMGKSWDLAALALRENRVELMRKFNQAAGAPSSAVIKLQNEFVEGHLEPAETVAFAKVCMGLIDSAA